MTSIRQLQVALPDPAKLPADETKRPANYRRQDDAHQRKADPVEGGDGGSSVADDKGTLPGYFSVGECVKVQFSKGNLQYRASTNTWRFAENQYDYVGEANANISETYDGWIDLFCWGTGDNPTKSSTNGDYSTFTDWGTNTISNGGNEADLWRTLIKDEFIYLFESRTNASALYGYSTVNNVNGLIILPDDWQGVMGITFTQGTGEFSHNTYTIAQWRKLESAGAVFLPVAGSRDGTEVDGVGSNGFYWSNTKGYGDIACGLNFDLNDLSFQYYFGSFYGLSVRLVR